MRYVINGVGQRGNQAARFLIGCAERKGWDREELQALWDKHEESEEARDLLTDLSDQKLEFINEDW